ncbi:MAG: polymorphic toxin type 50 domain-containing protein [Candidatus Competibacteraceae bacterium]
MAIVRTPKEGDQHEQEADHVAGAVEKKPMVPTRQQREKQGEVAGEQSNKPVDEPETSCPLAKKSKIHPGKQGKHQPGHNNFEPGKSELDHPDPQSLLDKHSGKGTQHGNKEVVDFKEQIGTWVSPDGKTRLRTTRGTIHHDAKGNAHIVPAHPTGQ